MPGFSIVQGEAGPSNKVETLRDHRWRIIQLGPIMQDSLLFAKELTLPEFNMDRYEILGSTLYYKFPKSVKWGDCTVLFYDTGEILPKLYKWRNMMFDDKGGIKMHNNFKLQCYFELLDGSGKNVLHKVRLIGAWPAQISEGRVDYASSAIKLVSVIIAFDYVEFEKDEEESFVKPGDPGYLPGVNESAQTSPPAVASERAAEPGMAEPEANDIEPGEEGPKYRSRYSV